MNSIHAHEILHMMEGKSFSNETLKQAITDQFGAEARFHTCSAEALNIDEIIEFLANKGKFKPANEGFTMDITKVCKDY